jgi:2'-hydroxyisoflavone reductase
MQEFTAQVKAAVNPSATLTWVDHSFLQPQRFGLPLVIPDKGPMRGLARVSAARAIAQGLTFRPIASTAKDTLAWFKQAPANETEGLKIDAAKEAQVLAAWKARG